MSEPPASTSHDPPPVAVNTAGDVEPLAGISIESPRPSDNVSKPPSSITPDDARADDGSSESSAALTHAPDDNTEGAVGGNDDNGRDRASDIFHPSEIEDSTVRGEDDSTYTEYDLTPPTTEPATTRQRRGNEQLLPGLAPASRRKKADQKSKSPEKTL